MVYTTKTFIANSGERFSQLYEAENPSFPLFYPTAFIVRSIRTSCTHETQKVYLAAIKLVCEWELIRNIDLAMYFHNRKFLSATQVDDLANYLRTSKLGAKGSVISNSKYNTYISYAASYIKWLALEVITETNTYETKDIIKEQNSMLLAKKRRKTGSKSAHERRVVTMKLSSESNNQLLDLFDQPFDCVKNSQNFGSRLRNVVMLRILYETGMRLGELLSLKLRNFIDASGGESAYLDIERNHGDIIDRRLHQPVAKTLGRRLSISQNLEEQLKMYIENWRANIPKVNHLDEGYIFVVHRGGSSQGQALPKTAFATGLINIKQLFIKIREVYPHLLRHDWNYRFSKLADSEDLSFDEERTLREQLMGWVPGSQMSVVYNRRHIEEKSLELGLRIASDTART